MKLARMDGWDLRDDRGEPWRFPDLNVPEDIVCKSHLSAWCRAKEILLRRQRHHRDQERPGLTRLLNQRAELAVTPPPPVFKSWLDYSVVEN